MNQGEESLPRLESRQMNPVDKLFLKMKEENLMKGLDDSTRFAKTMLPLCSVLITLYIALTNFALHNTNPPFEGFWFLLPPGILLIALGLSIHILKPMALYASPDIPERIRAEYIVTIEWRHQWNMKLGWCLVVGIASMFVILLITIIYGTPTA